MIETAVADGPSIPLLAGLDRDRWEILIVPADDPDAAFGILHERLGALQRDGRSELERLEKERLSVRNRSILAHGWDPVGKADWDSLSSWTAEGLIEVLGSEARRLGEACELPQLPAF